MFYRINKNIEYSTDYKFFIANQIQIVKVGTLYKFNSRLESKSFREKRAFTMNGILSSDDIMGICLEIHKEILDGKHGIGKLVK